MVSTTFHGASTHSLDDKSRLIVPKRFQSAVSTESNTNFVMTASPDGCLLLVDSPSFTQITEQLGSDPLEGDNRRRGLRRLVVGHAEQVKPDKAGRIVIPETLRIYMGLGEGVSKDVVVVGTGSAIEVWTSKRWSETVQRDAASSLSGNEQATA